jgi:hypothetical protein
LAGLPRRIPQREAGFARECRESLAAFGVRHRGDDAQARDASCQQAGGADEIGAETRDLAEPAARQQREHACVHRQAQYRARLVAVRLQRHAVGERMADEACIDAMA